MAFPCTIESIVEIGTAHRVLDKCSYYIFSPPLRRSILSSFIPSRQLVPFLTPSPPHLSTIIVIGGHNTSSRVFAKVNIFVSNIFRRYSNELNDRFIDKR